MKFHPFAPRIALVLSGGGGRGAYQVGVWRALRDLGLDQFITTVSGTSVGALNALLFAQDDFAAAEHLWTTLKPDTILSSKNMLAKNSLSQNTSAEFNDTADYLSGAFDRRVIKKFLGSVSFFSRCGLSDILDTVINPTRMKRALYVCASNIGAELSTGRTFEIAYAFLKHRPAGVPEFFYCNEMSTGDVKNVLLASSAIPVVFDPVMIEGNLYFDGGLTEHLPVEPVYSPKIRQLITVNLFRSIPSELERYPGVGITSLSPQINIGSAIGSSLAFDGDTARDLIEVGFRESLEPLKKLCDYLRI